MTIPSPRTSLTRAIAAAALTVLSCAAAPAFASDYQVIASFDAQVGRYTGAGLAIGADGLEYGFTYSGAAGDKGAIFRVEADGHLTVLHAFAANGSEGYPDITYTLLPAADGWLYGTTRYGGQGHRGVLFRISTSGVFEILHHFRGSLDGGAGEPTSVLAQDRAGRIYGGLSNAPGSGIYGAIFVRDLDGEVHVAHTFANDGDGAFVSSLNTGPDGRVYGTTRRHGDGWGSSLFVLTRQGYELQTLHVFDGPTEGCSPDGPLAFDDRHIYGAMHGCGKGEGGTIWKINRKGTNPQVLHNFGKTSRLGYGPSGVTRAADGRLFSVTGNGGELDGGTVFKMSATGKGEVLHSFSHLQSDDGSYPTEAPILRADGKLRGTTAAGGTGEGGEGTVYQVTP